MRATGFRFCTIAFICFSTTCLAADKQKPATKTSEFTRTEALKQVDEFGERMAKLDPSYKSKEIRILAAIPIIANNYSHDQWLERVQFLYAALSEIDAKAASIDPEAILSKYYLDEAQRAPPNAMSISSDIRGKWVDERAKELEQQLNSSTIDTVEHAARMLAVAKVYFPYDTRFVKLRQYRLDLAIRLVQGEIDKQRFDALWAMKRQENSGEVAKEKALIQQQQQIANDQAAAQQSAIDAQRRAAMLSNAARSVQNAVNSQRPAITCTAIANVMTCR